ncbi:MAG: ketoacyl-ACP synthase III [Chloroflexi bacterium]|nr:ketoacyl-ACP synthase III [Chloroflexota bacterium]
MKSLKYARIAGWGKYLPERIVTNQELVESVDSSDEWIQTRTGIVERRFAAKDELTSDMAVKASKNALVSAGLNAEDIELVIVATVTPEMIFPSCASLVQHKLGTKEAAAFDVNAACTGFIYAIATASQFISTGVYKKALVIGSEVYSRIIDFKDRGTCVLFGDGAGAVVLEVGDSLPGLVSTVLHSDGSKPDILYVPGPCGSQVNSVNNGYYLRMAGSDVFRFAVSKMSESIKEAVSNAGLSLDDIKLLIPHQANKRIIQAVAKNLKLPLEKFVSNIEYYGNTSAASIPIALCEAAEGGKIVDGDYIILSGVGGGLSWGALVFQWGNKNIN